MNLLGRTTGVRGSVLIRLAWRATSSHMARSVLTAIVIGLSVTAIVATSGRTEATRRSILGKLEDPVARIIRVVDRTGQAGLTSAAVTRVISLGAVEWAVGLSPAGPLGRNPSAGGARVGFARAAVGTRTYWGSLPGPLARLASGRLPSIGESLVGGHARRDLGLADGAGPLDDEIHGPIAVVGTVEMGSAIGQLDAYVLVRGGVAQGPISELLILARSSVEVESLVARLPAILGPARGDAVGIDRAPQLTRLRSSLLGEMGALDGAVLIGGLLSSSLLVGAMMYGAIGERRREFGIRRSQGAQRTTVGLLVVAESIFVAVTGSALGAVVGNVIVASQTGSIPDPLLTLAISALVTLAALLGSLPAAASAAFGEPLYVLRST